MRDDEAEDSVRNQRKGKIRWNLAIVIIAQVGIQVVQTGYYDLILQSIFVKCPAFVWRDPFGS